MIAGSVQSLNPLRRFLASPINDDFPSVRLTRHLESIRELAENLGGQRYVVAARKTSANMEYTKIQVNNRPHDSQPPSQSDVG